MTTPPAETAMAAAHAEAILGRVRGHLDANQIGGFDAPGGAYLPGAGR